MFQCLGLATEADGGCGEDWWHPECVVGLGRDWSQKTNSKPKPETISELPVPGEDLEESPLPPEFPEEDAFETFICYKCVDAHPWMRRYAGTEGFLSPVYRQKKELEDYRAEDLDNADEVKLSQNGEHHSKGDTSKSSEDHATTDQITTSKKRKASETPDDSLSSSSNSKKSKIDPSSSPETCKYSALPLPCPGQLSLFLREDFRNHLCRCARCYPTVSAHPQLLEEEESYEPPLSEEGGGDNQSAGTASLLDRGEAALSNVDRVRAIGAFVHSLSSHSRSGLSDVRLLTTSTYYRGRNGLQPSQGQGQELSTAICRKWTGCWCRRHQGIF